MTECGADHLEPFVAVILRRPWVTFDVGVPCLPGRRESGNHLLHRQTPEVQRKSIPIPALTSSRTPDAKRPGPETGDLLQVSTSRKTSRCGLFRARVLCESFGWLDQRIYSRLVERVSQLPF